VVPDSAQHSAAKAEADGPGVVQQFAGGAAEAFPMGGAETGGGASQQTTFAGRVALMGAGALGGLLLLIRVLEARRRTRKE
jgi:hypothetical protein